MLHSRKFRSRLDQKLLRERGLSASDLQDQMEKIERGTPFVDLVEPASVGKGIRRLAPIESERLAGLYQSLLKSLDVIKMVPASGAASRMFKPLSAFLNNRIAVDSSHLDPGAHSPQPEGAFLNRFFSGLRRGDFAFATQLDLALKSQGDGLAESLKARSYSRILEVLLSAQHMNYASMPKALIPFHGRGRNIRTALDEHFFEALAYGCGKESRCRLHFTVSGEHRRAVEEAAAEWMRNHSDGSHDFSVEFSIQSQKTDTLAVSLEGEPIRDKEGKLVFRPGGHGALIGNLAKLEADLVFIKNIDNVMPGDKAEISFFWKKVLGGCLLEEQERIFTILQKMELGGCDSLRDAENYLSETHRLRIPAPDKDESASRRAERIRSLLDRPVRVCGMVVNRGEPGGGPFWVRDRQGVLSLQIVEGAQVDRSSARQRQVLSAATHFNPVDLVCGVRNYRGRRFPLQEFINPETYFVSRKSREGGDLRALEWPGLWNGAMYHWMTFFVEVPETTFTPVKTVNDLLRPEHSV